ncbi:hypothetical protein K9M48_05655, partial [Candidatus Gracilibacteria bacterium]|nr:hypothetical protein [Candidatus Gracilibacteria bacterium]
MNSHKIGYQKRKNSTFKYISLFLFGILFALMATQAFTIVTGIENAVQYIKQIVVTSDGTASGTTGVFIEGLSGKVGANRFC